MDRSPTFDQIGHTLRLALGPGQRDSRPLVVVVMSMKQAENLAIGLEWRPTPTRAECSGTGGVLCCPRCGATGSSLWHETNGVSDIRPVTGFTAEGALAIETKTSTACCWPGDRWWIRCRRCQLQFHPPAGTTVHRQ